MHAIAPSTKHVALDAERVILTSSGIVYSAIYTNKSAGTVTITMQNTAGTTIGEIRLLANTTFETSSPRLYQDGVKYASNSDANVVVSVSTNNPAGSV